MSQRIACRRSTCRGEPDHHLNGLARAGSRMLTYANLKRVTKSKCELCSYTDSTTAEVIEQVIRQPTVTKVRQNDPPSTTEKGKQFNSRGQI